MAHGPIITHSVWMSLSEPDHEHTNLLVLFCIDWCSFSDGNRMAYYGSV